MPATTEATKAATISSNSTKTPATGDAPPNNIPANSNGMATNRGCAIVRNCG